MRSCFSLNVARRRESHCCYLRTQLERPYACVLHYAKLRHYNPSIKSLCVRLCNNKDKPPIAAHQRSTCSTPAKTRTSQSMKYKHYLLATCILSAVFTTATTNAGTTKTHCNSNSKCNPNAPKKASIKTTTTRSPSEETKAERDRRLYRECKGLPNAGACLGYTRK